MRTRKGWAMLMMAVLLVDHVARAASNDITSALQKGLFEEEANQNLPAAIEAYETVIQKLDENRKLAATAVFRLGECYRKMGRTNEATAQYQRVLREFRDQTLLVTLSEQNLGSLSVNRQERSPAGTNQIVPFSNEAADIQRFQQIVKDSPDLINAAIGGGLTPLQDAAQAGKLSGAEFLLQHGADPNLGSLKGRTALHMAVETGNKAMVTLLLSSKADVNKTDYEGQSPLHVAAEKGFKAVAELLVQAGADLNAKDKEGETPLHEAAKYNQLALTQLLLAQKADINARTKEGASALGKAVARRNLPIIKLLLDHKADPNPPKDNPEAAAADSTSSNDKDAFLAISGGGKFNPSRPSEIYPLHEAVTLGDLGIVKSLLEAGANPNQLNAGYATWGMNRMPPPNLSSTPRDRWTPLAVAIQNGRKEVVELLLDHKADPNLASQAGIKPLVVAISKPDIALLLLERGAQVRLTLPDSTTPLHKAVEARQKELVRALLEKKAEVNAKDTNGSTPLHYAIVIKDAELVDMLLKAGADPNVTLINGETALHSAVQQANPKMVELLLEAKADVNARNDRYRQTPLGMFSPVSPNATPEMREIAALLRRYGGIDDLPRLDQIEIRRSSANYTNIVFLRGTNDVNRFTLLEAIAVQYGMIGQDEANLKTAYVPPPAGLNRTIPGRTIRLAVGSFRELGFPDFARVKILEPLQNRFVESAADLRFPDCSRQHILAWGTVIEVPEADHPINASWQGLAPEFVGRLQDCLKREINLTVKGQSTNIVLRPGGSGSQVHFYLRQVLMDSGLIRTSSDLSRVKVKRQDRGSGGAYELTVDCSPAREPGSTPPSPDLWVLDGDVIEVPDKP